MPNQIHSLPRRVVRRLPVLALTLAIGLGLIPLASASASSAAPVTPFVDCVAFNGDQANPVYTAYFGYNNTGPVPFSFAIGGDNGVSPGPADSGQPTTFGVGNYPRVFAVQFDGQFLPTVTWDLNGVEAQASVNSPACAAGATAPASDVGSASATLNGVVADDGQDTTYSFEYGPSTALGISTPDQAAGTNTQPQLVQAVLATLTPATQYYFRLDTSNALTGTSHGQLQSFTTAASAPALISAVSGATQTATLGTAFAVALQAKVIDGQGNPVPGAPVTFAAPTTGASGTFPSGSPTTVVQTDSSGLATAPTLTANTTAGSYSVDATVAGAAIHASFMLSNAPKAVGEAATTTHLASSTNPARILQPVTYMATVTSGISGLGTPTGKVTFADDGAPVVCTAGSQTLNSSGTATCRTTYRETGTHLIVATYGGNANFQSSQSPAILEVVSAPRLARSRPEHGGLRPAARITAQ